MKSLNWLEIWRQRTWMENLRWSWEKKKKKKKLREWSTSYNQKLRQMKERESTSYNQKQRKKKNNPNTWWSKAQRVGETNIEMARLRTKKKTNRDGETKTARGVTRDNEKQIRWEAVTRELEWGESESETKGREVWEIERRNLRVRGVSVIERWEAWVRVGVNHVFRVKI